MLALAQPICPSNPLHRCPCSFPLAPFCPYAHPFLHTPLSIAHCLPVPPRCVAILLAPASSASLASALLSCLRVSSPFLLSLCCVALFAAASIVNAGLTSASLHFSRSCCHRGSCPPALGRTECRVVSSRSSLQHGRRKARCNRGFGLGGVSFAIHVVLHRQLPTGFANQRFDLLCGLVGRFRVRRFDWLRDNFNIDPADPMMTPP